jgi:hypothetical protein
MQIRNRRLWRSDSARGDTKGENSIRIESGESDQDQDQKPAPKITITNVEITFHRQKSEPISIRKLLRLKHDRDFNNLRTRD